MDPTPPGSAADPQPVLAPEDYYFEGPNMVFTAAYHLKRGSCCNSGCRHCPYLGKEADDRTPNAAAPGDAAP
ncbi:MAG: DUF5522 domain-containing protein [Terracidiphilus sp.]